jgi:hypothetical protein
MRWLACAWLLVGGCFEPPTGPDYRVTLLSADPPIVPVHGGEWVTVSYDGVLPEQIAVDVDGVFTPIIMHHTPGRTFTIAVPAHTEGVVSMGVIDLERGIRMAFEDDLLAYEVMPAQPTFALGEGTAGDLSWELHPELSRPCARGGDLFLSNFGDEPMTFTSASSSNAEFAIDGPSCGTLAYGQSCQFQVCFTSNTPGIRAAMLTASTTGGDAVTTVQATVTPALTGLDPTFHGGGVAFDLGTDWFSGRGSIAPSGFVTWAQKRVIALDATGTETHRDLTAMIGSTPLDWIMAVRADASGIYALVTSSSLGEVGAILRFDDMTSAVTQIDLPFESSNYYYDLQIAPGGRLLAIGSNGVVAIANGAIDTTYGTSGRVVFPTSFSYVSVLDSQGRLYALLSGRIVRITANGTIDGSFSYTASPETLAIDAADRVYTSSGVRIIRLTQTGAEDLSIFTTVFASDITVDASGRIYVLSANQVFRYTNGSYESTLGYGTEYSVVCPASGGCYLLGYNTRTTVPFFSGPSSYVEKYALRLAN